MDYPKGSQALFEEVSLFKIMILECDYFKAEQGPEGKIRLEIVGAKPAEVPAETSYEADRALERLSELLGRPVSRGNLAYWRQAMNLPYKKLGLKKFVYREADLVCWCKGRTSLFNI